MDQADNGHPPCAVEMIKNANAPSRKLDRWKKHHPTARGSIVHLVALPLTSTCTSYRNRSVISVTRSFIHCIYSYTYYNTACGARPGSRGPPPTGNCAPRAAVGSTCNIRFDPRSQATPGRAYSNLVYYRQACIPESVQSVLRCNIYFLNFRGSFYVPPRHANSVSGRVVKCK